MEKIKNIAETLGIIVLMHYVFSYLLFYKMFDAMGLNLVPNINTMDMIYTFPIVNASIIPIIVLLVGLFLGFKLSVFLNKHVDNLFNKISISIPKKPEIQKKVNDFINVVIFVIVIVTVLLLVINEIRTTNFNEIFNKKTIRLTFVLVTIFGYAIWLDRVKKIKQYATLLILGSIFVIGYLIIKSIDIDMELMRKTYNAKSIEFYYKNEPFKTDTNKFVVFHGYKSLIVEKVLNDSISEFKPIPTNEIENLKITVVSKKLKKKDEPE